MTRRILVVDDEPATELLMRQIFRKEVKRGEYELSFAFNGDEALVVLEGSEIELVMTDINMPGMDGLTLLSHIHESYTHIKVIMISAYNDKAKIEMARGHGACEFINKPIKMNEVRALVRDLLGL